MKNGFLQLLIAIGIFLAASFLLNFNVWRFFINSENRQIFNGDGVATQLVLEYGHQHLNGSFFQTSGYVEDILYPFGKDFDKGGLFFVYQIFRLFFNPNHALILSLTLIQISSSVLMYFFLKKLKVTNSMAVIFALSFAHTPFISKSIQGHFEFLALFVFPLSYLIIIKYLEAKKIKKQLFYSILISLSLLISFLMNYYYFVALILSLVFTFFLKLITQPKLIMILFKTRYLSLILSFLSFILLIYPFIFIKDSSSIAETRKNVSPGSSIYYSASLENFLIPSYENKIYLHVFDTLQKIKPSTAQIISKIYPVRAGLVYPGFISLLTLVCFFVFRKKLPIKLKKRLFLPIIAGLFFAILTLGPFLKVFHRYHLDLDGVAFLVPMPYLIFHFVPGLESMRSPERFTPAFVFFILIAGAVLTSYFYKRFSPRKRISLFATLLIIFIIDQNYKTPILFAQSKPFESYKLIALDKEPVSVMEIPFVLRDGIEYMGFIHGIDPFSGILEYDKPILGGYFARVNSDVFDYYRNLKFVSYVLAIIDKGNYDPDYQQPLETNSIKPYPYNITATNDELDFLSLKYFVLKKDEKYTSIITDILLSSGAELILNDKTHQLFKREVDWKKDFAKIDFTSFVNSFFIGGGLQLEDGYYSNSTNQVTIFFKPITTSPKVVTIKSSGKENTKVQVILNNVHLGSFSLGEKISLESFKINNTLKANSPVKIQLNIAHSKDEVSSIKLYEVSIN